MTDPQVNNRTINGGFNPRTSYNSNRPPLTAQDNIDGLSLSTIQTPRPSSANSNTPVDDGVHLRAKLRFFLMSPCWKWHLKHQRPWKAWFQFLKIIIVTIQLIIFGYDRQTHVVFISESNITFHHLFVQNWDSSEETLLYPPATGDFAVYTKDDFRSSINYAVTQFDNLSNLSLGLFDYRDPSTRESPDVGFNLTGKTIRLCMDHFTECYAHPANHTYRLNITTENTCFRFNATDNFDIEEYLTEHNQTINLCGLNLLQIEFAIHAIQLKNQKTFNLPDCYHFLVQINFDNNARTGKIQLRLDSFARFQPCHRNIIGENSTWLLARRDLSIVLDSLILFITTFSFILCVRSVYRGHRLCREVRAYYAKVRPNEVPLKWTELQIFYSFWYFLMIATDLMIFPATIIKMEILFKRTDNYNASGLLLGISSLFSWVSILRYLTFFRKYNILFLTIQKAFPILIRFFLCVLILYCGFMFCGWLVLGPYHVKFETLASTSETLFSLVNGDDMYATFANIETESTYIWLFSQIYLLSFVSLFIYVCLSLTIALIMDGYETVKKYHINGYPKSRLQKFSEENIPQWSGPEDWQDLTKAIEAQAVCFPCCFKTSSEVKAMINRDVYLRQNSTQFS